MLLTYPYYISFSQQMDTLASHMAVLLTKVEQLGAIVTDSRREIPSCSMASATALPLYSQVMYNHFCNRLKSEEDCMQESVCFASNPFHNRTL